VDQLSAVWQAYGVFREIEQTDAGGYLVAHTSRVYVVDVSGNLSLSFAFGTPPDDVANDLRILLK
jgi:cytochrome oxidase Cu insertion factor (SCO1/SenC/PrrC family)